MSTRSSHILHVDDDASDTLLIQQACRKANVSFQLHSVSDGETAIAYLRGDNEYADRDRHPLPVLVLLDLKMPRKGGFDVLAWIRKESPFPALPVIIFTASNQEGDIQRAYEMGANSYLVKPVGINTLTEMVKMLDSYWLGLNQNPVIK